MMDYQTMRDANEPEFNDLFQGCRALMRREVLELHSNPDDDGTYVFIVWAIDWAHADQLFAHLKQNASPHTATVRQLALGIYSITEEM